MSEYRLMNWLRNALPKMFTNRQARLWGAIALLMGACVATSAGEAVLRPGDTIELKIGGVPSNDTASVSGAYMIDGQGYVNMPNLGKVKIGGLTTGAAQGAIESGYRSHDIYTNPTIIITMQAQSRWVNVGGEVNLRLRSECRTLQISQSWLRSMPPADFRPLPINAKCDCSGATK